MRGLRSVVARAGGRRRPSSGSSARRSSSPRRLGLRLRGRLALDGARGNRNEDDHGLGAGGAAGLRTRGDAQHQAGRDEVPARRRVALAKVLEEQHIDRLHLQTPPKHSNLHRAAQPELTTGHFL